MKLLAFALTFLASGCAPAALHLKDVNAALSLTYVSGAPDFRSSVDVTFAQPSGQGQVLDIIEPFTFADPFTIGVLGKDPVAACDYPACSTPGLDPQGDDPPPPPITPAVADFTGGDFAVAVAAGDERASFQIADLATLFSISAPSTAAAGATINVDIAPASFARAATFKLTPKASTKFSLVDGGDVDAIVAASTASLVIPANTVPGDYFITALFQASSLAAVTCTGANACTADATLRAAASITVP